MKRLTFAIALATAWLFAAPARAQEVGYQFFNVAGTQQTGNWQGFQPGWIPSVVMWERADLGVTTVVGPVAMTGTTPPTITLSGTPSTTQTAPGTAYLELDCTTLGILGTSLFTVKVNGATTATNVASASSGVVLTGSGLTAGWAAGASAVNDVYTWNLVSSAWADSSGQGNSLSQTNSSQQLTIASVCIHGRPCLSGNSAAPSFFLTTTNATVILSGAKSAERFLIAVNATDPPSGGSTMNVEGLNLWGTSGNGSNIPFTNGGIYDPFCQTGRISNISHTGISMSLPYVYDVASATTAIPGTSNVTAQMWLDGESLTTATNTTFGVKSGTTTTVGMFLNSTAYFGEYIVFNAALDQGTRTRLLQYESNLWGITLAATP